MVLLKFVLSVPGSSDHIHVKILSFNGQQQNVDSVLEGQQHHASSKYTCGDFFNAELNVLKWWELYGF